MGCPQKCSGYYEDINTTNVLPVIITSSGCMHVLNFMGVLDEK